MPTLQEKFDQLRTPKDYNDKMFPIRLDPHLHKRLKTAAKREGLSMNGFAVASIEHAVEQTEQGKVW